MSGLLFLCHRLPFPPNKGDKIRSYHVLSQLCAHHKVYLGTLIDDPLDWQYASKVTKQVEDACIVESRRIKKHWPLCLKGFLKGQPLSNVLFYSPQLQLWVDGLIQSGKVEKIYIFSSVMAQYVLSHEKQPECITDFVDVDSLKWQQYAKTQTLLKRFIYKTEAKRLSAFETKVAHFSKRSIFVSSEEADLFKKFKSVDASKVMSIQNGVDTDYFMPQRTYPNPYQGHAKKIVFTGMMDYWPNIEAVTWFVKKIFPALLAQKQTVEFYICGAKPTKAVFSLSQQGVIVTGRVPDIRPYLHHADCVVAPLRIARGVQNKILEALSMNKPIVASLPAVEGLRQSDCPGLLIAKTEQEFVHYILDVLANQPKVMAHDWVKSYYSWASHLQPLNQLFEEKSRVGSL